MWYEKAKPEEESFPSGYQESLDVFRKLLLIRSWSPDRTLSQARKYIVGETQFYMLFIRNRHSARDFVRTDFKNISPMLLADNVVLYK